MTATSFGIVACVLMGAALGVAGLVRFVMLSWARSNGIAATGRVVRLEQSRCTTTDQLPYTPIAEFEANGHRYEAKGSATFPPLYRVGDAVPIYYPCGRPDRGKILTGREWAVAWCFVLAGLVFVGFGIVIAIQ
jgi:hypothetical protein